MKIKKVLLLTLLASSLCACATEQNVENLFKANSFETPFDLHTEKQNTFLALSDASQLSADIKGLEENSRPKAVSLTWEDTKSSSGYLVRVSDNEEFNNSVIYEAKTNNIDIYNLKTGVKYYYQVKEDKKDGNYSEIATFSTKEGVRNLYIDGVTNVRDLGGWNTESGVKMKQGLLFRGGRLNNSYPYGSGAYGTDYSDKDATAMRYEREITSEGIKEFNLLGIKNEIDLRNDQGDGYPGSSKDCVYVENVPGVTYNACPMTASDPLKTSANKASVKKAFELMADRTNYPLYFHCNIGTNRTGTIAMLVEALCGVSYENLLTDYMFSNFGTICVAERQYDNKAEKRAEVTDVTASGEVYNRIVNAKGDTISEKAIEVLMGAGLSKVTCLKVKNIMLGNN